jgi:hypothetical protein
MALRKKRAAAKQNSASNRQIAQRWLARIVATRVVA